MWIATTACVPKSPAAAMRHDPASAAIVIMLCSLKMHGMATVPEARLRRDAVTDLTEPGAPAFEAAVPMRSQRLKAEIAEREVRTRGPLHRLSWQGRPLSGRQGPVRP